MGSSCGQRGDRANFPLDACPAWVRRGSMSRRHPFKKRPTRGQPGNCWLLGPAKHKNKTKQTKANQNKQENNTSKTKPKCKEKRNKKKKGRRKKRFFREVRQVWQSCLGGQRVLVRLKAPTSTLPLGLGELGGPSLVVDFFPRYPSNGLVQRTGKGKSPILFGAKRTGKGKSPVLFVFWGVLVFLLSLPPIRARSVRTTR